MDKNIENTLKRIKASSPKNDENVLRLREEHACLMELPADKMASVATIAIDSLIRLGYVKRKPEYKAK